MMVKNINNTNATESGRRESDLKRKNNYFNSNYLFILSLDNVSLSE